ncbi:MAG: hypothetical protein KAS32_30400 [Candidatus Peribacteraceae bacterium]|nr:hypothetical protein [Candidatus Peribacteraceae bacterium]
MFDGNEDNVEDKEERGFSLPYVPNYEFIETEERAKEVLTVLMESKVLAVDTETTGLDPYTCRLLLLQIATPDCCYILNCGKIRADIWNSVLESKDILKLAQYASFDYKILKVHAKVSMRPMFCTMIAERLITVGKQFKVSLQYMASKYLGLDLDKEIRKAFIGVYRDKFSRAELMYAANDALILFEIYDRQIDSLQKDDLVPVALLEFNTIVPISEMELNGCLIDKSKWRALLRVAGKNRDAVEEQIKEKLSPVCNQLSIFGDCTINISSQKQLLIHLRRLGIDIEDTSNDTLKKVNHPVTNLVRKWRSWEKICTSYGEKFLSKINEKTGRLHARFNQVRADTGRTSSSKPNLQQIPGYDPDDSMSLDFRSCFIASLGYDIVGADYSQQELRILAEVSQDKNFLDAYLNDEDIHTKTACLVYNKKPEEVTKKERLKTKVTNFTISYGGSAYTIAKRLNISEDEAISIVDGYFKAYPGVKNYIVESGNFAVEHGYSVSISGRRRYYDVPSISDLDYKKKIAAIKRKGSNMKIQGSAADVSKQALCNFFYAAEKVDYDVRLIMFVHDEIILEVEEEHAEEAARLLEKSMVSGFAGFFKQIPMKVDAEVSKHWSH